MSEHIRQFEPQVTHIGTGTWLNNHLAYASVFPPAYRETLVRGEGTRKVSDHCERIMRGDHECTRSSHTAVSTERGQGLSSWGQYITSDLKLNESRAGACAAH